MRREVIKLLKKATGLKEEEIKNLLEIPPSSDLGDYAFPCFSLAGKLKKDPKQIALDLKEKIKLPNHIDKIQVKGAYVNFFLDRKVFAREIIGEILSKKQDFGKRKINLKGMIEFSQANTHKAFHVGHIRGTSIGESLARIAEFFGEKVVRVNYQGDTGMHVAKWLWCYQKYHSKEKLKRDESWIASIYVDAIERLRKSPKLQEEADIINQKLESRKDKKLNELWKKTRKFSLDAFEKIYRELDTKFDKYYFESQVEKQAKKISRDLVEKKIAEISDGATIVNLEKYNLGIWVLLRKDHTVLYSAKDLALAEKKFQDYKIDWSIYVIADSQSLHMKQLFKTLELMNFKRVDELYHVSYGLVRLPTGKMSSRTGENILYSDFLKDLVKHAKEGIKKKWSRISKKELEARALKISISAMKYSMLKQGPNKDLTFDPKKEITFEGNTGPYLLYSYARASSILRKVKATKGKFKINKLNSEEFELAKKLSQFPEIVYDSHRNFNPSTIANYCYKLAQIFNEFYHSDRVIGSEEQAFRLALVSAFRHVLKNSLWLLGIDVLEEM